MRVYCQSSATAGHARLRMRQNNIADLVNAVDRIGVISTDVFDTLLLRNSRSERSRIMKGERLFSHLLAQRGWKIAADLLVDARLKAQRLAFRGLTLRGVAGEARLVDIIGRQLSLLGLPHSLRTNGSAAFYERTGVPVRGSSRSATRRFRQKLSVNSYRIFTGRSLSTTCTAAPIKV